MKFLLRRIDGDYEAAEEIFADTFLSTWKTHHPFQRKNQFFT